MKRKLGTIISLSVVAVLAIAVVILYLIPVNYIPKMDKPNQIIVEQSATENATILKDNENYNKILNAFNDSLTRNLLSAFFAGQTTGGINTTANGELPIVSSITSTYPRIRFDYTLNPQNVSVNGHKLANQITEVLYQLSDSSTYAKTSIYLKYSDSYYYDYSTYASQAELYDLISELNLA